MEFEDTLKREVLCNRKEQSYRPAFRYLEGSIVFGEEANAWSKDWKARVQEKHLKRMDFRTITKSRHWLFHNTSSEPPYSTDLVVAAMGRVLSSLKGIGSDQKPPMFEKRNLKKYLNQNGATEWAQRHCLSMFKSDSKPNLVHVRVKALISGSQMAIPVSVTKLTGRKQEVLTMFI